MFGWFRRKQEEEAGEPFIPPSPEPLCTGCGSGKVEVRRNISDLCSECGKILEAELKSRREAVKREGRYDQGNKGPYFFTTYARPRNTTIGVGLYIARTPAAAMAEARRIALHNGWKLLAVGTQPALKIEGLGDIETFYRHPEYQKYFPGAERKFTKPIPFDEQRFGL